MKFDNFNVALMLEAMILDFEQFICFLYSLESQFYQKFYQKFYHRNDLFTSIVLDYFLEVEPKELEVGCGLIGENFKW